MADGDPASAATVALRPVAPADLAAAMEVLRAGYAAGMVEHGGVSEADAQAKADRDMAQLVPGGVPVPTLDVLTVEADGAPAGYAMLGERSFESATAAFVYAIELDPAFRGRGIGRAAMELLEERARARGHDRIELNVFGGNAVARGLYRSLGYEEVAVFMGKTL